MKLRRIAFAACLQGIFLLGSPATAQTIIDWIDPNGGNYTDVFNWSPLNVPNTVSERARFNIAGTYDVTVGSGTTTTVADLWLFDGDVTLAAQAAVFATYATDSNALVDGGNLTLSDEGGGGDVTLNVGSQLQVTGGSTMRVLRGSDVDAIFLFVGTSGGDGTLVVDGSGSTLDAPGSVDISVSNTSGSVTYSNSATGTLGRVDLAETNSSNAEGYLNVLSGAVLTIGDLDMGTTTSATATGIVAKCTVDGGQLTMDGASQLTIGSSVNDSVVARLLVQNGGTFSTGTGTSLVQNSGDVIVETGGTLNVNGDFTFTGGAALSNDGQINFSNLSTARLPATFDNGGTLDFGNDGVLEIDGQLTLTGTGQVWGGELVGTGDGAILDAGQNRLGDITGFDGTTIRNLQIDAPHFQGVSSLDDGTTLTDVTNTSRLSVRGADVSISGMADNSGDIVVSHTLVVPSSGLTLSGGGRLTGVGRQIGIVPPFSSAPGLVIGQAGAVITNLDHTLSKDPTQLFFNFGLELENLTLDNSAGGTIGDGVTLSNVHVIGGAIAASGDPGNEVTARVGTRFDGAIDLSGQLIANSLTILPDARLTVNHDGRLDVGGPSAFNLQGSLRVDAGGEIAINAPGVYDWSGGSLGLANDEHVIDAGVSFILDELAFDELSVAANSTGFLRATFGDDLVITSGPELRVTGDTSLNTTLRIEGGAFTTGSVSNRENIDLKTGTLHLTSQDFVVDDAFASSVFTVRPAATLIVDQQVRVPSASRLVVAAGELTGGDLVNDGSLDLVSSTVSFANASISTGTVNAIDSTLTFDGGLASTGELNLINSTINGPLSLNGGGASIVGNNTLTGHISGSGDYRGGGNVAFTGTYAPGNSPAEINFEGNLELTSTATLTMELGGTSSGSGYDRINVAGTATLDGTLDVLLIDGFEDSITSGDQFVVLDATALTGAFANIAPGNRLAIEEFGGEIRVDYGASSPFDPNQVVLSDFTIVPIVATWVDGVGPWTTAANWDINAVPDGGPPFFHAVVPTGTAVVDAPIEVYALDVPAGGAIQVDNDLSVTNNGHFSGGNVDVAAGAVLELGGEVRFEPGTYTGEGTISPLGATVTFSGGLTNVQVANYHLDAAAETIIARNTALFLEIDQLDDDNKIDGSITLERGASMAISQSSISFWEASALSTINFENNSPETSLNSLSGQRIFLQGTLNVNGGLTRIRAAATLRSDPDFVPGSGVERTTVNMNPAAILRFDNSTSIVDAVISGGGKLLFWQESSSAVNIESNVDIDVDAFETGMNGTVSVNGSTIRTGEVALDSGSMVFDADAAVTVSDSGTGGVAGFFVGLPGGTGSVSVANGAGLTTFNANVGDAAGTAAGTVEILDGTSRWDVDGNLTIEDGGIVEVVDGVLASPNGIVVSGGELRGTGTVAAAVDVSDNGRIAPGLSPGLLTVSGDYTQSGEGILAIELGGTAPGAQFDVLAIDGTAALGGTLEVSTIDLGGGLFTPVDGDSFEILTAAGGLLGTSFDVESLPALGSGLVWNVGYEANRVVLDVLAALFESDFDGDGDVDGEDFLAWQSGFGQFPGGGATKADGDADGDGDVDGSDFLIWQNQFGSESGAGAATAVPEPGGAALTGLALVVASWRTRRRRSVA